MGRQACFARRARRAAPLLVALALCGCQRGAAPLAEGSDTEVFAGADELPPFRLEPMGTYEMGDFELRGDKQCRFAGNPADQPLVLATGFLRRPQAPVDVLVKYGGQIVAARSVTAGGFDAVRQGATFDTGGMIVDVARITLEPDGSGPAAPDRALLRVTMAGQEQEIVEGYWSCSV